VNGPPVYRVRCRANSAEIRQSRPDYGLVSSHFQAKVSLQLVPVSLGRVYQNVQRFRGGLVCKAHRLLYHSTLGLSVIQKKKKKFTEMGGLAAKVLPLHLLLPGCGFRISGLLLLDYSQA